MMEQRLRRFMFGGIIVVIGIGVAMGVLFPAGRNPFVPRSSAVAMRGQNLYCMIAQNDAKHDIDGKWFDPQKCSNSVEFVTEVLGVSGANGDEALWNVAVDVPKDYGDFFPMLISANFNPRLLENTIDNDAPLPIGRASGAPLSLLDDKAIILVRKNGSSEVIKAKHCTRRNILKTSCESSGTVVYLTPESKITVSWTTESAIIPPSPYQP